MFSLFKKTILLFFVVTVLGVMIGTVYGVYGAGDNVDPFKVRGAAAADDVNQAAQSEEEKGLVPCKLSECTACNLFQLLERIFNWLLALAFVVAVLFVVVSGFLYIVSVGDQNLMGMAKDGLKYSIIGFVICLTCWLAVHIVYILMDYSGDNWWQIECQEGSSAGGQTSQVELSQKLYKNEVPIESLGGRNNPLSLPQLAEKELAGIPDNKYFFIHGLGGQPTRVAARQLAQLVKSAREEKKIIFAAVPDLDKSNNIIGTKLINLNNFLSRIDLNDELNKISGTNASSNIDKKTIDQFYDQILSMLLNSVSQEIPLLVSKESVDLAEFNKIWPEANWTGMGSDGAPPLFQSLTNVISGLKFEEGNGPFFYDPDRYGGTIPADQTHIQINLNPDGSLDTTKPISVLNVPAGVSKDTLEEYLGQVLNILFSLDNKNKISGTKGDLIFQLTDLLSRSVTEKPQTLSSTKRQKSTVKTKTNQNKNNAGTTNTNRNYANSNWNGNTNANNQNQAMFQPTGVSGILPSQIAKTNNDQQLSDKQISDLIKKFIGGQKQGGSSFGGGSSSGSRGNDGSSTGNNGTNNGNDWSKTSFSSSGYSLNEQEKQRLESMITGYLKEMNLNVPPEFIMCIIKRESNFKPELVNNRGEFSVGLMQVNKGSGTDQEALAGLKKYAPKTYRKLLEWHGSDANIISTKSMQSKNDPAEEKGTTIIALGIAYLKKINVESRRGGSLKGPNDWDNLAGGYSGGPGGPSHTDYSTSITACTMTMVKKRATEGSSGSAKYFQ